VALSPVRRLKEIPPPPDEGSDGAQPVEVLAEPERVPASQLPPLDALAEPTASPSRADQVP
jgi:hypothetical protein